MTAVWPLWRTSPRMWRARPDTPPSLSAPTRARTGEPRLSRAHPSRCMSCVLPPPSSPCVQRPRHHQRDARVGQASPCGVGRKGTGSPVAPSLAFRCVGECKCFESHMWAAEAPPSRGECLGQCVTGGSLDCLWLGRMDDYRVIRAIGKGSFGKVTHAPAPPRAAGRPRSPLIRITFLAL